MAVNGEALSTVLPLSLLDPNPTQAGRGDSEADRTLAESIRQYGVLQPIGVVKNGERYRVAWGNRRKLCSEKAGRKDIPAVVLDKPMSEAEFLLLMGTENIARQDWKPCEVTDYLASLAATGMSNKEMAEKLCLDQGLVSGHRSIATKLIPAATDAYRSGALAFTKAVMLSRLDAQEQHAALSDAMNGTRDDLAKRVRKKLDAPKAASITIVTTSGRRVMVKGADLTLGQGIEELKEAAKIMEKGEKDGLSAKTISKASAERARA